MSFEPYFISSYLNRNFMIPLHKIKYSTNLKTDFGLNNLELSDFLSYLEQVFEVQFPKTRRADQYEYLLDIIFYIVIFQYEMNLGD
jgi:hypothetical protein